MLREEACRLLSAIISWRKESFGLVLLNIWFILFPSFRWNHSILEQIFEIILFCQFAFTRVNYFFFFYSKGNGYDLFLLKVLQKFVFSLDRCLYCLRFNLFSENIVGQFTQQSYYSIYIDTILHISDMVSEIHKFGLKWINILLSKFTREPAF